MQVYQELPILKCANKLGKPKIWCATVVYDEKTGVARSHIQFGIEGGKLQDATRDYTTGKNIGKRNETTPLLQCVAELKRKWQDKIEKEGYSIDGEHSPEAPIAGAAARKSDDATTATTAATTTSPAPAPAITEIAKNTKLTKQAIYPMLAQTYEPETTKKKKYTINYPCYVQPKLDGLRCIAYFEDGEIKLQSRTATLYTTMQHVKDQLAPIFQRYPRIIFDGELYTTEIPFEELAGLIKKKTVSSTDRERLRVIQYHIYDVVDTEKSFKERLKILHLPHLFGTCDSTIQLVETAEVTSKAEFRVKFQEYVECGYEGIMLRNFEGKYQLNTRSHDLQKYKEFHEAEYPIVGYKEGEGRDKGTVIWLCKTPEDKVFAVRPRGTIEIRSKWFKSADKYVGKPLTVIYQELSEMNVPRFPVGKAVRESY